jgi:hypothetical protein
VPEVPESTNAGLNALESQRRTERWPPWLRTAVQLFGLTGLAFAQPLFSLLGDNPTYFVAHGVGRFQVIVFALLVILVPTVVFTSLVLVIRAISSAAGDVAMAIAVGLLVTLSLVSAIGIVDDASPIIFLLGLVLGSAIFGLTYLRFSAARSFVTFVGPAPILFAVLFLFASPARALVVDNDPAPLAAGGTPDAPVVVLLFDELPLGALLDGRGNIDAERFPNFARLAASSTWYPNATTVSPWTHLAVPAILTGSLPDQTKPPVAGQYPHSLFTLLGGTYTLDVAEQITSLCPESLCTGDSARSRPGTLAKDTGLVVLHQLLPASLADRWLPSISGQWADFGGGDEGDAPLDGADLAMSEWQAEIAGDEHESDFDRFLASLTGETARTLWYHHEMVVHMPYRFLPDGTTYPGVISGSLSAEWIDWVADPSGTVNARQRFLLQLAYADRRMGEFLDVLEERDLFRDALVAVVADHGISFQPGGQRRGVTQLDAGGERVALTTADMAGGTADEIMPVPLFVKYPGQATGDVDERPAQTVDLLPTIADALDISLPDDWVFDGRSLLSGPPADTRRDWVSGSAPPETFNYQPDPNRMATDLRRLVGPGGGPHDLYAVGAAADLVGQKVDGRIGSPADGVIHTTDLTVFDDIDPTAPVLPVLFTGLVVDVAPGSWVAVALNGTVAGLGPVFVGRDGIVTVEAMLDPSLMSPGRNEVQLFVVGEDDATLHPIGD